MRNDMYLYRKPRRKKSKFKLFVAVLALLIISFGISSVVYLIAKDRFKPLKDNFPTDGDGVNIALLTQVPEDANSNSQANNDNSKITSANNTGSKTDNTKVSNTNETTVTASTGLNNNESNNVTNSDDNILQAVAGPYGLWKSEKKEEIKVNPYQEPVWMSDFVDTRVRNQSKGIYLSASYINGKFDQAMKLIDETELNAVVIDIKDDSGYITYQMDYDVAKEIGATTSCIADLEGMIKKLKDRGVYVIARIVTLKDPLLAKMKPELALKNKDGSVFYDNSGLGWVNPYLPEVWEYLEGVCVECVNMGFDEVNLDYIRFSTDKGMANVDFGEEGEEKTRIEVISEGIKGLCETIKPLGAFISCDVYGAIITSSVDAKIVGQAYREMSRYLDYICPMVYPSHYGAGYYGLDYPDIHPYELVKQAMEDSKKTLSTIPDDENRAIVRPWLQDFTASWLGKGKYIKYEAKQVRDQINAVYDAGYSEWLLWNAGINYTKGALKDN